MYMITILVDKIVLWLKLVVLKKSKLEVGGRYKSTAYGWSEYCCIRVKLA